MQEPSASVAFSENAVVQAFQAASAFREALQALVTVSRSVGFTVGMEAEELSRRANTAMDTAATSAEARRPLHGGKRAASG